jgi:AcrR family transcriptional regulator
MASNSSDSPAPRQRMTRDEQRVQTRTRLLDAAESLFGTYGIAEPSIEQIAEEAGYSRGAFYSNFEDKDALVLALIERHQNRSMAETDEVAEVATGPDDFLTRLFERSVNQSEARSTIAIEYILYASRNASGRPKVRALNQRLLAQHTRLAQEQFDNLDVDLPLTPDDAAKILLGLDEGFALLRLLDPQAFPRSIWGDTVGLLNEAMIALGEKRSRET